MSSRDNTAVVKLLGDFSDFLASASSTDSTWSNLNCNMSGKSNGERNSQLCDLSHLSNLANKASDLISAQQIATYKSDPKISTKRDYSFDVSAVDFISAKNIIAKLESKVSSLETANKRARIECDSEKEQALNEQRIHQEKFEDSQNQLRSLFEQHKVVLEELESMKQRSNVAKVTHEEKTNKLLNENILLKTQQEEQIRSLKETISKLRSKNLENEDLFNEASQEIDLLNEKLATCSKTAQESLNKIQELELFKDQCIEADKKIKELETKLAKQEDNVVMNRILQSQLHHSKEFEKENKKLKDENRFLREENSNKLLLEEKLHGAEEALKRSQQRYETLSKIKIENEELTSKLQHWEQLDESDTKEKSPRKIAQYIADLQMKETILLRQFGEATTIINLLNNEKTEIQKKLSDAEQEIKMKTVKLQMNAELIKRLQKKLLLVTKERDSYKNIIASYEKEVTLNTSAMTTERIQTLENLLENAHLQISNLEKDLETANAKTLDKLESKSDNAMTTSNLKLNASEEKNNILQEQISNLLQEMQQLKQEKENLELQLEQNALKGDYNPSSTKVIHLKTNPLAVSRAQCKNELEELRNENMQLCEKIRMMQENRDHSNMSLANETVQKQLNLSANKEIDSLREQLKKAEIRHQRFMEAFTEKSQEFREVCYMLFGYRVDMISEHQYKLISMYAERSEDYLLFKLSNKGELQLLGTEFSIHVSSLIETYLQKQHSIPAFLSSLTLDLFIQQTSLLSAPLPTKS